MTDQVTPSEVEPEPPEGSFFGDLTGAGRIDWTTNRNVASLSCVSDR